MQSRSRDTRSRIRVQTTCVRTDERRALPRRCRRRVISLTAVSSSWWTRPLGQAFRRPKRQRFSDLRCVSDARSHADDARSHADDALRAFARSHADDALRTTRMKPRSRAMMPLPSCPQASFTVQAPWVTETCLDASGAECYGSARRDFGADPRRRTASRYCLVRWPSSDVRALSPQNSI